MTGPRVADRLEPVTAAGAVKASRLAQQVSPAKLAERAAKCRICRRTFSAPGRHGPLPELCKRCHRAAEARWHMRTAARIARELGNDALADALTRLALL